MKKKTVELAKADKNILLSVFRSTANGERKKMRIKKNYELKHKFILFKRDSVVKW